MSKESQNERHPYVKGIANVIAGVVVAFVSLLVNDGIQMVSNAVWSSSIHDRLTAEVPVNSIYTLIDHTLMTLMSVVFIAGIALVVYGVVRIVKALVNGMSSDKPVLQEEQESKENEK